MSDEPNDKQPKPDDPPDGRGERPTDPNELAKWIVDQATDETSEPDALSNNGSSS